MSGSCLHCGSPEADTVVRVPGTRLSKRVAEMDPVGWYYFMLCSRCRTIPKYEYTALWKTYTDRLVHSDRRYDDNETAIMELF